MASRRLHPDAQINATTEKLEDDRRDGYGEWASSLLATAELCPLGPGQENESAREWLEAMTPEKLFDARPIRDREMARCCESGLWLLHNYLDESHTISQAISTPEGSYWHGIMHRREPDYSNAKYWFRQTGDHPIFASLGEAAQQIDAEGRLSLMSEWDPFQFVDDCQAAARDESKSTLCRKVAEAEWALLFDYCYERAIA